jgi:3-hydroxy-9,10-secoandrosta-1,3,5(10)-triene-9,17-dione monooxygenase reductase component
MAADDEQPAALDTGALRTALGAFATGVTIVSTRDPSGEDVGVTANSFNSVSLDPPMVLWSLSRKAMSLPSFQSNPYFAVHILAADQDLLSLRFSTQGADKFGEMRTERGLGNVPLIDGCAARFQCRTGFNYDGGDHVIFVGEVLAFESYPRPPLLYHAGRYALAVEKHPNAAAHGEVNQRSSDVDQEFLFGLLGRAHNQMYQQIQAELGKWKLSDKDRSMLSVLGAATTNDASESGNSGIAAIKRLVDAARAAETRSGRGLGPTELQQLKQLLQKLVGQS